MVITGYLLRHALKRHEQRRNVLKRQFDDALFAFAGETKPAPTEVAEQLRAAEANIATLQVVQARYNLAVAVTVDDRTLTLHDAVKRVGGAARLEGMWSKAAGDEDRPWNYNARQRSTEEVYAERTMALEDCLAQADAATRHADALREAIAVGNAQEVEIDGLDSALFE